MSVLIAALNEEQRIGASIRSARAAGAGEVIVVDGGSTDATASIAAREGARVIWSEPMRARQFNRGAAAATGQALIFLHADTLLPPGAADAVTTALGHGAQFGGFRLRFAEKPARLAIASFLINLRTAMTRCPWGDQAQFIARTTFLAAGGFQEISLMEDYELAVRMKRRGGSIILPLAVTTSGRRFLEKGLLRTTALNWRIIAMYKLGVDPERLARMYRRSHSER